MEGAFTLQSAFVLTEVNMAKGLKTNLGEPSFLVTIWYFDLNVNITNLESTPILVSSYFDQNMLNPTTEHFSQINFDFFFYTSQI